MCLRNGVKAEPSCYDKGQSRFVEIKADEVDYHIKTFPQPKERANRTVGLFPLRKSNKLEKFHFLFILLSAGKIKAILASLKRKPKMNGEKGKNRRRNVRGGDGH